MNFKLSRIRFRPGVSLAVDVCIAFIAGSAVAPWGREWVVSLSLPGGLFESCAPMPLSSSSSSLSSAIVSSLNRFMCALR